MYLGFITKIDTKFMGIYWRKVQGCYREFGTIETIHRTVRELIRRLGESKAESSACFDISLVTEDLAIGAAPISVSSIRYLVGLGFTHVIDLRAKRKQTDILMNTKEVSVHWVPTYDDWRPKSPEFYRKLETEIKKILLSENGGKLLLCCESGEHRAPLAGVLALVILGYSLERAIAMIERGRPKAELLPIYMSSLIEFLR